MLLIIVYEVGCDITRLIPLIPKYIINNYDPFEFVKSCRVEHVKYLSRIYLNKLLDLLKYRDRDQHLLLIMEDQRSYQTLSNIIVGFADFIMIQEGRSVVVVKDRFGPLRTISIP